MSLSTIGKGDSQWKDKRCSVSARHWQYRPILNGPRIGLHRTRYVRSRMSRASNMPRSTFGAGCLTRTRSHRSPGSWRSRIVPAVPLPAVRDRPPKGRFWTFSMISGLSPREEKGLNENDEAATRSLFGMRVRDSAESQDDRDRIAQLPEPGLPGAQCADGLLQSGGRC